MINHAPIVKLKKLLKTFVGRLRNKTRNVYPFSPASFLSMTVRLPSYKTKREREREGENHTHAHTRAQRQTDGQFLFTPRMERIGVPGRSRARALAYATGIYERTAIPRKIRKKCSGKSKSRGMITKKKHYQQRITFRMAPIRARAKGGLQFSSTHHWASSKDAQS